jgi:hypothetical protein
LLLPHGIPESFRHTTDKHADYLQALSDENKINVEKIGSGNWYWSFASQDKKTRQHALDEAETAHTKAAAIVSDLKAKVAEAEAQRADEEDMLDSGGESREDLMATRVELEAEVKGLAKELAAYSDSDPTELAKRKAEVKKFNLEVDQYSDDILSMESFVAGMVGDQEQMLTMKQEWYGDQFDEEEGGLRELV